MRLPLPVTHLWALVLLGLQAGFPGSAFSLDPPAGPGGDAAHKRAHQKAAAGDLSGALAEMGQAMAQSCANPDYPGCRADLYLRLGMPAEAEADLSRAAELGDRTPSVLGRRAVARMQAGRFAEALPDLREVMKARPEYEYAWLWALECLRQVDRGQEEALRRQMTLYAEAHPAAGWGRALFDLVRGAPGWSEQKLLAEAENTGDSGEAPGEKKGRLVEAWYYLGQERLWKGDPAGAAELFLKVVDSEADAFYEVGLARGALKRMRPRGAPGMSDLS